MNKSRVNLLRVGDSISLFDLILYVPVNNFSGLGWLNQY